MQRLTSWFLFALVLSLLGFSAWLQYDSYRITQKIAADRLETNRQIAKTFQNDILLVQAVIDNNADAAITPGERAAAQQALGFAREWLLKAELAIENKDHSDSARFELSTARFWMEMALKDVKGSKAILSYWAD